MNRHAFSFLFVSFVLLTGLADIPATAQTGIYAAFTAQRGDGFGTTGFAYGPTVGVYSDRYKILPLHLGIDLRGSTLYGPGNASFYNGLGGIRASVVPHLIPFKVYGEGLVGAGVTDVNGTHSTRFQWQVNGGLEYTFFPRLDWRVAELAYSGFAGSSNGYDHPLGLSTGIVVRLP